MNFITPSSFEIQSQLFLKKLGNGSFQYLGHRADLIIAVTGIKVAYRDIWNQAKYKKVIKQQMN